MFAEQLQYASYRYSKYMYTKYTWLHIAWITSFNSYSALGGGGSKKYEKQPILLIGKIFLLQSCIRPAQFVLVARYASGDVSMGNRGEGSHPYHCTAAPL